MHGSDRVKQIVAISFTASIISTGIRHLVDKLIQGDA